MAVKKDPNEIQQAAAGEQRYANRSQGSVSQILHQVPDDTEACLGYAEMGLASISKLFKLGRHAIGKSHPMFFLDIGSGVIGHLVMAAELSGLFVRCTGIEIAPNRFLASQQAVKLAQQKGLIMQPVNIVHGDVLSSSEISLDEHNFVVFFDKVCITVSQKTMKKYIEAHVLKHFQHGPILYFTCMGTNGLQEVISDLKQSLRPQDWDRLLLDTSVSTMVTTRYAGQKFLCTMVRVWQSPCNIAIIKMMNSTQKAKAESIWSQDDSDACFEATDMSVMQFKRLQPLSWNPSNCDLELTNEHLNRWKDLLMDLVKDIDPQQDNTVLVMNTYFYTKVKQQSVDETSFQQAEKWIIKAHGSNADTVQHLFEKGGHLIFPNHKKGNPVGHWFSTEIDFMNRKVCFMDSVLQDHTADFKVIVSFLKYLQRDTAECKLNEWQMEEIQVPTQQNGYDCGVFTALFILYSVFSIFKNRWGLVQQPPMFPFHQSDIENVRYAMTVAFMENSLTTVLEKWFLDFYTSNSHN